VDASLDNRKLEHDELKLLYQACVSDLAFFKQQQWSIANYALLLYGALVAAVKLLQPPIRELEPIVLQLLVVATAITASIVLWKHEAAIGVRRTRLAALRNELSQRFNRAWETEGKRDELVSVACVLQAALVVGALVALWVLARQ
jgi:hypothetical protein